MVHDAAIATSHHALAKSYEILPMLSGKSASHSRKSVKTMHSTVTTDTRNMKLGRQQHLAEVFGAEVKHFSTALFPMSRQREFWEWDRRYTSQRIEGQIKGLGIQRV